MFSLAVALAAAAGVAASVSASARSAPPTVILVMGDSLSSAHGIRPQEGWVHLLGQHLGRRGAGRHEIVNLSVSGETTGGGRVRLPGALKAHRPDLVILELGGNDGLRGYPVERIRDNLNEMIVAAKTAGSDVLLLGMKLPPNYGLRYTGEFAGMYEELAGEHGLPFVPFFLEGVAASDEMQPDGIHPTAAAQPRLFDNVWPTLNGWLEKRNRP